MDNPVITLYSDADFFSPYVMSVFVALTEKQLPFELKKINLSDNENMQQSYAQLSFTRRVPTLIIDDFRISESSAITEYLDEAFPAPAYQSLYPNMMQQRAKTREIQAWLRSDLLSIRLERPTEVLFGGMKCPPLSTIASNAADKLFAAANWLLADGQDNLNGEWSIADTDLALMLNRLVMNGDDVPANLQRYVSYQWQRPSVQQWLTLSK
ncbi:glutathione S-transferase [Yersinia entomophaga]|uniref:Glutathione S-transferase n=1 Tax=Yersinia entomophaga TaxID=935293 RepID=A0ABM6BQK1_YERET|nr:MULTISPECIES: glutathione transferase [Yersinia]ANI31868.1 glutathione S-transferase [Yersinia entomophaga]OWF86736.1 glutathione S-transferase [Yersinia entomophaga]